MSEWDYKTMGFDTQEEMEASLERVRKAKREPVRELQQRAINYEKTKSQIIENGALDLEALEEGARIEQLDNEVRRRLHWEQEQARRDKEAAEINSLLSKAGDVVTAEKQAAADARIKKETEKMEAEIKAKRLQEQGLKSEEEINIDNGLRDLLKGMRGM